MHGSKTDKKNIPLLKLLARLRDHIDRHRIIGLNVAALREGRFSNALLQDTLGQFRTAHSDSLGRLKACRDTIGAHSDDHADITSLPSHAEFETLFSFAKDFYEVVSRSIIGGAPAVISRRVGSGFMQLIESLGVQTPRFDFEDEE